MPDSLVLFDVDGTLIDTAGAGRHAIERAFDRVFATGPVSVRAVGVEYAGRTDPRILADVARAVGIAAGDFARRRGELLDVFLEELGREMQRSEPRRRVLPGVLDLLEDLAAREGVWLGLVTGNLEAGARVKLEPFGLNRFFPTGGFSSDHEERREIARIARDKAAAHARIDFPPERVTVIGDTPHDVDCARANRFRALAVHTGWVTREALERAAPDVLLDGFGDRSRVLEALALDRLA